MIILNFNKKGENSLKQKKDFLLNLIKTFMNISLNKG